MRKPSSCTRRCSLRLAPIAENSSLLPPVGVWAVLNPSVADRPLRPATDRCLGRLLPHQPANRPRAQLPASCDFALPLIRRAHAVLSAISRRYSSLKDRSPMCSSPVRHSLPVARKRVRLACVGTPPAFILSQDQTRHPMCSIAPLPRRRGVKPLS